jgi:type I restriction enzyme S subunit
LNDGTIPVYGSGGIIRYVDTAIYDGKSVLIPRKGSLGNLYYLSEPFWTIDTLFYTEIDETKIIPEYFFYLLSTIDLAGMNVGTAVPSLTTAVLNQIEIEIPPLAQQKAIADALQVLDNKINVNKKLNHHLEQIAQAIFKSWFVDFEPFGCEMPDNWQEGTISDLGDVVGGSTPSKAKPEYYTEHGIAWITPKDLSINKSKFIARGANDITELGLRNSSARLMPSGAVLFSSRAPIGYIAIASGEVCTNQGFKSVIPKANVGTAFIYYFLIENLQAIEGMASGSTFKEVSGRTIKAIPAIIPDDDTLRRFQEECTSIFMKQELLEAESVHLAVIRDSLIPRLISGELSVDNLSETNDDLSQTALICGGFSSNRAPGDGFANWFLRC